MPALQTWRALGLSVAVGYTSFGALELLWPARAGRELLDIEPGQDAGADSTVALMGRLLGARDLSNRGGAVRAAPRPPPPRDGRGHRGRHHRVSGRRGGRGRPEGLGRVSSPSS